MTGERRVASSIRFAGVELSIVTTSLLRLQASFVPDIQPDVRVSHATSRAITGFAVLPDDVIYGTPREYKATTQPPLIETKCYLHPSKHLSISTLSLLAIYPPILIYLVGFTQTLSTMDASRDTRKTEEVGGLLPLPSPLHDILCFGQSISY